jgi:ferredoxin
LVAVLLGGPLIVAAFAFVGHRTGNTLARLHPQVQLAMDVAQAGESQSADLPQAVALFRASGQPAEMLYAQASGIQKRYRTGAALVGVWMGLVISGKLIAYSIRRRRGEYRADSGTCLACARCFDSCPVELKRRGVIAELPVVNQP